MGRPVARRCIICHVHLQRVQSVAQYESRRSRKRQRRWELGRALIAARRMAGLRGLRAEQCTGYGRTVAQGCQGRPGRGATSELGWTSDQMLHAHGPGRHRIPHFPAPRGPVPSMQVGWLDRPDSPVGARSGASDEPIAAQAGAAACPRPTAAHGRRTGALAAGPVLVQDPGLWAMPSLYERLGGGCMYRTARLTWLQTWF